jgi:conjugal transfer pilus assembly protein TraK
MHRAVAVWALGLLVGMTAPAVAAQDVGIELPVVPAAVVAARGEGRLLRVAASTAEAASTDTQLALGPRTVTVEPGTTVLVEVAVNHLNRIVTPFAAPQVRTVSAATTEVDGNVVYVATPSEEPIALYLSDGGDSRSALSLTLAPRHVPPREVRLQLSGGPWRGGIAPATAPCHAAAPYIDDLVGALRELARERRPAG